MVIFITVCLSMLITIYLLKGSIIPETVTDWLHSIGKDRIIQAIKRTDELAEGCFLCNDQKRKQTLIYMQKQSIMELGYTIPEYIANLLLEYVFYSYKTNKNK